MADDPKYKSARVQRRVRAAQQVLTALGLPRPQQNEGAALVLLSLIELRPSPPWSTATNSLRGTSPLMEWIGRVYGKRWATNTRESVRKKAIHYFREAGLVLSNPDMPGRPITSPKYCYQVPSIVVRLLRSYGSPGWERRLKAYLAKRPSLAKRYAAEREMARLPLRLGKGVTFRLSPGGQNELIREVVKKFCPRFTPGAVPLYIGDAYKKFGHFNRAALAKLGVEVSAAGKMPDLIVYFAKRKWLVLIEAVTTSGPIDPKRRRELRTIFGRSSAGLVYVTAFMTLRAMRTFASQIAWATEVWVAEAPSHLVHFDGERFLGPYD